MLTEVKTVKTVNVVNIRDTVIAGTISGTEPQLHCAINDKFK
jgi:hypothetical protein